MKLTIRLFASLKDKVGQSEVTVDVAEPATIADIEAQLVRQYPALGAMASSSIWAVNELFASGETAVSPQDTIALFPPVSGGSSHPTYFAITDQLIDVNAIQAKLQTPEIGAITTFTGFVRGKTDREGYPTETLFLEYEAYNAMAERKMAQIAQEIWQKWPQVKGVAIVQRVGQLTIGDVTTFVACASGHRDEGCFAAARYGIDRLKEIVPVWKKEVGPDGSTWVEGDYRPTVADN